MPEGFLYALYNAGPGAVVHRIPVEPEGCTVALCGFDRVLWFAIGTAPRELLGQHRECRRCARRAITSGAQPSGPAARANGVGQDE